MGHVFFFLLQNICDLINLKPGTKLSEEEFVESHVKLGEDREKTIPPGKNILSAFFDMMDADADGKISLEEFKIHYRCSGVAEEHAKAVFDALDTDNDGIISRDEFVDAGVHFYYYSDPAHPVNLLYGPLVD